MRIALLYASWEDFGEPWSTPQGVRRELERRGHDVRHFNLYHDNGRLPARGIRNYSNQGFNMLHKEHQTDPFDVIMVMDYGPWQNANLTHQHFPGAVLVKECGDEPQAFRLHTQTAQQFDILLSPDMQCVGFYKAKGLNAHFWTHFADTTIFNPYYEVEPEFDCVTTCGGRRFTAEIEAELNDKEFNNERYFYGEDHARRLSMGNIVFQSSQHGEITRRIFEGMACGKMVLADRLPPETEIDSLFTDGQDIVYFTNAADAIEKIRYYTANPKERNRIALNGFRKVMECHTQVTRVDQLERLIEEVRNDKLASQT